MREHSPPFQQTIASPSWGPTWPIGAGVDRVLDYVLNDASRPLEDFASGDQGEGI